MVTMAIMTAGAAVLIWQRKPANRALACSKGAAAAGWVERKLSDMAQSCRPQAATPKTAARRDIEDAIVLPCIPQPTGITAAEVVQSWVMLH